LKNRFGGKKHGSGLNKTGKTARFLLENSIFSFV
jgi:hypothetical protein